MPECTCKHKGNVAQGSREPVEAEVGAMTASADAARIFGVEAVESTFILRAALHIPVIVNSFSLFQTPAYVTITVCLGNYAYLPG